MGKSVRGRSSRRYWALENAFIVGCADAVPTLFFIDPFGLEVAHW